MLYSHVLENPTSLQGEFASVAHVLVGHLKLLALSAHLTQRFISNLFCFGTQTSRVGVGKWQKHKIDFFS
jgi:hypothetical protein